MCNIPKDSVAQNKPAQEVEQDSSDDEGKSQATKMCYESDSGYDMIFGSIFGW